MKLLSVISLCLIVLSCGKQPTEVSSLAPKLTFTVKEDTVFVDETIHLEWFSEYSNGVSIDNGIGLRDSNGDFEFTTSQIGPRIFTCTAFGGNGLVAEAKDTVFVHDNTTPIIPSLLANIIEDSVDVGDSYTIKWETDGNNVLITYLGQREPIGQETLLSFNKGTIIINFIAVSATGHTITDSDSIIVYEKEVDPIDPIIPTLSVTIDKDSVDLGETFIIKWNSDAIKIVIDNGIGERGAPAGQEVVSISDIHRVGWNSFNVTAFSETNHSVQTEDSIFVKSDPVIPEDQIFELNPGLSILEDESKFDVVVFDIVKAGNYRIIADVWYNSGDQQKNESFYITISDDIFPLDPNAGIYKVVSDVAGEHFGIPRDCGLFSFRTGTYSINVLHYSLISDVYPQFLDGEIDVDSIKIVSFRIIYVK